jgi:LacI family transcriptional regulator
MADRLRGAPDEKHSAIADVARHAGVSQSTVSRVLNDSAPVSAEVRERVEAAIRELRYTPNALASGLRRGRSQTIGVLVPDVVNTFYAEIARAIEDTCSQHDYNVILCHTDENQKKEERYLQVLRSKRVDGIIMAPTDGSSPEAENCIRSGVPVVEVDRRSGAARDAVVVDNESGAYQLIQHLLGLGHRRIAVITGPSEKSTGRERLSGYRRALQDAGLTVDPALIFQGDFRAASGHHITAELLKTQAWLGVTALFVANNAMATGAINAIREAGVRVPGSLALGIFDDPEWARLITPPTTAVQQPAYLVGSTAADLLMKRLRGTFVNDMPAVIKLQPHLVVRQSCGEGHSGSRTKRTGGST